MAKNKTDVPLDLPRFIAEVESFFAIRAEPRQGRREPFLGTWEMAGRRVEGERVTWVFSSPLGQLAVEVDAGGLWASDPRSPMSSRAEGAAFEIQAMTAQYDPADDGPSARRAYPSGSNT